MRTFWIARQSVVFLGAAGLALSFAACSGGGGIATSSQAGAQPQSVAYMPQTVGAAAFQTPSDVAPATYVPAALIGRVTPNALTKPIIDDSGSFAGGPIIIGTNTAKGTGVEGYASASGGNGIVGMAPSTNSGGVAVFGESNGVAGYGVYGFSTKGIGVRGYSGNGASYAGYFSNTASGSSVALDAIGNGSAIIGTSNVNTIIATSNNNGTGSGNAITGNSANSNGVVGTTTGNFEQGGNAGVLGQDQTPCGNACLNYGVAGTSTNGYGVFGSGETGVYGTASSGAAMTAFATGSALGLNVTQSGGGTIMTATNSGGDVMSLDGSGNMILAGTITTSGTPLITGRSGRAQLENVGDGQLAGGHAYVTMDSTFAAQLDPAQSYHVFVTPEGDSNGLYVTGLTRSGFTVRENHNGTASVAFSYRIVGASRHVGPQRPIHTPASVLRMERSARARLHP
jgi:hypothetical protein